jgi:hypothetical protein
MCFVFTWEQTATCATYSINWLAFINEIKSVYSAVRAGSLNKAVCASSLKGLFCHICLIVRLSVCSNSTARLPRDGFLGNLMFEEYSKNLTGIKSTSQVDLCTFRILSRWILVRIIITCILYLQIFCFIEKKVFVYWTVS